ncbi:MAG: RNA-binding S4 domain-containing protein [Bacteroidales bacterium]|nr:RNA-binding S4 domain-containing protein [Bacteroidales bacterium]
MEKVRVDKWLWAVRIYKTRAQATDACKGGRILVNGITAKPSKELKAGDMILIRKLPVIYSFFVKQVVEKRLSAKLVPEYLEDHTSIEELEKLRVNETYFIKRDKGSGRPTKRERRQIDKLNDLKE